LSLRSGPAIESMRLCKTPTPANASSDDSAHFNINEIKGVQTPTQAPATN